MLKKYDTIVNPILGESFPANLFHFYPLEPEDYFQNLAAPKDSNFPLMVFYHLTHKCWDACPGCFVARIEDRNAQQDYALIQRTMSSLAAGGTRAIKFAGRESTVHPDLGRTLELCAELGLKTVLITSGANLGPHAESIADNCTHLRVSLNTTSEKAHNRLHRPGKLADKYCQRLRWTESILKRRSRAGLVSGSTFLIRPATMDDAISYAHLCQSLGFNYVRYTVLDEQFGEWPEVWQEVYNKLLAIEDESFKIFLNNPVPQFSPELWHELPDILLDPSLLTRVTIHANGKVNACPEGWRAPWPIENMATYGNLNEESFEEIWLGQNRRKFLLFARQNMRKLGRRPPSCQRCKYDNVNSVQLWMASQALKSGQSLLRFERALTMEHQGVNL